MAGVISAPPVGRHQLPQGSSTYFLTYSLRAGEIARKPAPPAARSS